VVFLLWKLPGAEGNGLFVGRADIRGVKVTYSGDDGVYANTTNINNEYGLYTPDKIYGSNITSRSGSSQVRNIGNGTLEAGDLVCIAGGWENDVLSNDGVPVINVTKANSINSSAVIGVVEYKLAIREEVEEHKNKTTTIRSFRYTDGSIMKGDYLSIIVWGPAEVKIINGDDIKVGDILTVAIGSGQARSVKQDDNWQIGTIGKALEDNSGKSTIKAFINCK